MKLALHNTKGIIIGSVDVRDDVFDVPMNAPLVHQVMVGQLANRRQGTAKTKTRAEVAGGGAKPRPQKSTGRARQGSIRSPQWRGGGIVFGPIPRSYRQRTTKRMKRQSLKAILSDKVRENQLVVVENLELENAKTKDMAQFLQALDVNSSVLLVGDGAGPEILRAANNLPKVRITPSALLNTLSILNARKVVMTLDAVRNTEVNWGGPFVRRRPRNHDDGAQEE